MFKLSSSGPCETRRAHWIPCENPVGKSRDLPWMFPFLLQLSNGTEETQYTSILILIVYKQNIFSSPWSVLTLLLSPEQIFFVYSFILTKFWRPTTQDSNWAEVLFERSVLDIRFIRLKKPHLFRIVAPYSVIRLHRAKKETFFFSV